VLISFPTLPCNMRRHSAAVEAPPLMFLKGSLWLLVLWSEYSSMEDFCWNVLGTSHVLSLKWVPCSTGWREFFFKLFY
jgi:hypothetical protein